MTVRNLWIVAIMLAFMSRQPACLAEEPAHSLDELLKEYKRLGMPLPPKEAVLIRYDFFKSGYGLAFLLRKESDTKRALILEGDHRWSPEWDIKAKEVEPEPDIAELASWHQRFCLAMQCYDRGWEELTRRLLELSQKEKVGPKSPRDQLYYHAWQFWLGKVSEPNIDRAPVAKRLHEIIQLNKNCTNDYDRAVLKSLDAALVPSKGKPGKHRSLDRPSG